MKRIFALSLLAAACSLSFAGPGRLDRDGDKQISRAEAAAHPKLAQNFDALDTNKDGMLSREEMRAGHQRMRDQKLAEVDVNKDGWIDRNEAAKAPKLAKHFDGLDTNKDGLLSKAEVAAAPSTMRGQHMQARFAKLDANKDGAIDKAEAAGHPRLVERFDALDANKDGRLSMPELQAGKPRR